MSGYTIAAVVVIAIVIFIAWMLVKAGDDFDNTFEDEDK